MVHLKKEHGSSSFPNFFVLMMILFVSTIFPKEHKGLNLRGMASKEDLKLTNAIIALKYLGFNDSVVTVAAVTISINAAGQGERQSKGRNEGLHHDGSNVLRGRDSRVLHCLYTFPDSIQVSDWRCIHEYASHCTDQLGRQD